MDSASMNHYEQQLYSVFKTFDVDNEEALDKCAVVQLCDALQLDDRGGGLVDTLFERRADRVTFAQFRNGLLAVLGGDGDRSVPLSAQPEPSLQPDHSDEDSSGREVAPKFIFGSKKYGRRSRPQRPTEELPVPRASSASRLDSEDKRTRQRPRCRRSVSAMETRDETVEANDCDATAKDFDHDKRIDREQALVLCRDLRMEGIDRRLVDRIFQNSPTAEITVGVFFDRLNASLTTSMEKERGNENIPDISDVVDDDAVAGVASDLVVEAWERAGVRRPRRLLAELGFGAVTLRLPELERALDEELRALPEPPAEGTALLLAAAFALGRLRLSISRRRAEVTSAERDKLRVDLAEANKRAVVLAQEVDESQTRLENELRASLRRAEARQVEATRTAAAEVRSERERSTAARASLEGELARRSEVETRLRSETVALRERIEELEASCAAAERRRNEAERERARLAAEARAAPVRAEDGAGDDTGASELMARLEDLRHENQQLRDQNDELCAELERAGAVGVMEQERPRGGDLSTELSLMISNNSEVCRTSPVGMEQKLRTILEGVLAGPDGSCRSCAALAAACRPLLGPTSPPVSSPESSPDSPPDSPLASPLASHVAVQTDSNDCIPEEQLDEDRSKLVTLVSELEWSLEQMRNEYERCEEYWGSKLRAERAEHEAEARAADERLAQLAARLDDYERRFAPALPPVPEAAALEAQYEHLEDEFAQYRARAERRLAECAAAAPAPAPAPAPVPARAPAAAPGPGPAERELRGRLSRAEAAVRRLHGRLAAADLLVKELYVENCQLAHRRAL